MRLLLFVCLDKTTHIHACTHARVCAVNFVLARVCAVNVLVCASMHVCYNISNVLNIVYVILVYFRCLTMVQVRRQL